MSDPYKPVSSTAYGENNGHVVFPTGSPTSPTAIAIAIAKSPSLEEIKSWNCEQVCQWLKSFDKYSEDDIGDLFSKNLLVR